MIRYKTNIKKIPLGKKNKLPVARIMVYQFHSVLSDGKSDWENRNGLIYPKNIEKFKRAIIKGLDKAEEKEVNLIIFPELAVPEEMISYIQNWSIGKNTIVVAGSHYKLIGDNEKPFNACPVIYNGEVKYTMKRDASKFEEGLIASNPTFNIFVNTLIGNFAVIICSDYLSKLQNNFNNIAEQQDLDFCIVPAFQPKAEEHLTLMSGDIRNANERYIVFCNNKNDYAEGNSAFFAILHNDFITQFKEKNITNYKPMYKAVSPTIEDWDYFILKVDIDNKIPKVKNFIGQHKNIDVEEFGSLIKGENKSNESLTKTKIISNLESNEKVLSNICSDNSILKNVNYEDFNILTLKSYNEIIERFNNICENQNAAKELVNPELIKIIIKCLDDKGISFITAPIRFGKSFLLKYIQKTVSEYNFISEIKGDLFRVKKDEIKSLHGLYYFWFKIIAENILNKIGLSKLDLKPLTLEKIESEKKFISWLENNRLVGGSNLQGLVKCLADFKSEVKFLQNVLVSFHLDDIHKYSDENIFWNLRKDLIKFKNDINCGSELTVKILVASRYFPSPSLKKVAVNILPYFEIAPISNLINYLKDEMSDAVKQKMSYLILEKTDGYPWFVIRFFKIYLQKRIKNNKLHPLILAIEIFEDEKLWTMDSIFGDNNESEFFEELVQLIEESKPSHKSNFKRFIQLKPEQTILNDGWTNENDFLLRQSGFMKIDYTSSIKENNGCYIMKKHFQNEIEKLL